MKITETIKKLIDNTQYVAALEEQNALLKENLKQEQTNLQEERENHQKEKNLQETDEEEKYQKRSRNYIRPIADMQNWLLAHYDFRYNVITDVFEYRKKSETSISTDGKERIDDCLAQRPSLEPATIENC